ncbi:MAG: PEP-CTERM sorting domain-containing protein [Opitutaceae bacterium]|jgi:hypothetical protein|nr:PEP-CTERM sorting domain-containing protein [Opitutaceae bacterium]
MKTTMKHITLTLGISLAVLSPLARAASPSELVRYDNNQTKTAKDGTYSVSSTIGFAPGFETNNLNAYSTSANNWFSRAKTSGGATNLLVGTGDASIDEAAAVALDKYFTFAIAPTDGNTLTLTEVALKVQGDVGAGLPDLTVTAFLRSSADNYTSTIATVTVTTPKNEGTGTSTKNATLTTGTSGVAFSGLAEEVTFRLYAYVQSEGTLAFNHIVRFDDVRISGYTTAAVVPEPTTTALLAGAAMMLAAWGMRRRRHGKN